MADPAVCGFLTGLLCAQGGRLALRELLGFIELSEKQLLEVLNEAGPERFVLLDEGPDAGQTVLATTPVRVCRRVTCGGACEALHLCKLNLLDRCRRDSNYCKYSHDIHSEKNIRILKKHDLSVLSKTELAVLLLQSDPFFLPDICKYYKGENRNDSCTKTECMKLHICEHFVEGKCGYVRCNRSHDFMDTKVLELLKEEGLTTPVIRNIQDICNQKHLRSKKHISRRGRSTQRNGGCRSQSRNRYFFGSQELPTSPPASVETAHVPALLPSSEGKVHEGGPAKINSSLSQDGAQAVPVSTKTVSIQGVSQLRTNSGFPTVGPREARAGAQGGTQCSASSPASATPAVDGNLLRKVTVLFGSEADSCLGPVPSAPRQSESVPSLACMSQGGLSSPALGKTAEAWGLGSSAVVFSKYKPAVGLKKEESPSKSKDGPSTLVTTATWREPKSPAAASAGTVRSGTAHQKELQGEAAAQKVGALAPNVGMVSGNGREEPQKSQSPPGPKAATAHTRPKALPARDDPLSGAQKHWLDQSSLPTAPDLKTAAASLKKQVVHKQRLIGSPTSSVSASSSSQTLAALTINKSRAVSPSKSTNAEDFRARVNFNTAPSGMENNASNKLCLDYLNGDCKLQGCCTDIHFHLPYRWQVYIANIWKDFKDMEEIEKAYCDPSISRTFTFRSHSIDFQEMLFGIHPVRRLSTPSTVQNHNCALATKWHWYWKNDLGQWIEYGKEEDSEFTSEVLEFFFLLCPETFMEFSAGHHKYNLNFNEMTQTNIVSGTRREVRRRPKFMSSVTIYWNQKRAKQSQEQNTKESFNFPLYWNQMDLSQRKYELFEIKRPSSEYSEIECAFKATMKNFEIQKIMRIQNPSLWNNFQWKQKTMLNEGNKKLLFHAADQNSIDSICSNNFSVWSPLSFQQTKYGTGIYFTKDAISSHINIKNNRKIKIMFVAYVLVGMSIQGKVGYTPQNSSIFDSYVDNMINPSIFVINDKDNIYPHYIIEYTGIDKGCNIS